MEERFEDQKLMKQPLLQYYSYEDLENPQYQLFQDQGKKVQELFIENSPRKHQFKPNCTSTRNRQKCKQCQKGLMYHLSSLKIFNGRQEKLEPKQKKMNLFNSFQHIYQLNRDKDDNDYGEEYGNECDIINNGNNVIDTIIPLVEGEETIQCQVCYNYRSMPSQVIELKCKHVVCKFCFVQNIQVALKNIKMLGFLKCPQYGCSIEIDDQIVKEHMKEDEFTKFEGMREQVREIRLKKKRYCPHPDCGELVPVSFGIQKTQCPKCQNDFCKDCQFPWHEGQTCEEVREKEFGEWADKFQANKCPRCNARVEKAEGCQHMTCGLCGYEWCWICSLPYKSFIHLFSFGGLFCELLGCLIFKTNKCLSALLVILFTLFLPLLIYCVCVIGAGSLIFFLLSLTQNCCCVQQFKRFLDYDYYGSSKILKFLSGVKTAILIAFAIGLLGCVFASAIVLGTLFFIIAVIPLIIGYFILLMMLFITWQRKNMI